jgi:hypothetical protein
MNKHNCHHVCPDVHSGTNQKETSPYKDSVTDLVLCIAILEGCDEIPSQGREAAAALGGVRCMTKRN